MGQRRQPKKHVLLNHLEAIAIQRATYDVYRIQLVTVDATWNGSIQVG